MTGDEQANDHADFAELYSAHVNRILGYALRRVATPEDAADVVAETFLVAWRRHATLPPGVEVRLWLYGVARHVIDNQMRSRIRRERLGQRLRDRLADQLTVPDPSDGLVRDSSLREAMERLGDLDREVLRLTVWEDLAPREIAIAIGISADAVRTRLSRARRRLRRELGDDRDPAPPADLARPDCPDNSARPVLVPEEDR